LKSGDDRITASQCGGFPNTWHGLNKSAGNTGVSNGNNFELQSALPVG
jgi:hypothetical protein